MVVCSSGDGGSGSRLRRTTAVLECTQCRRKFLNEADRQLHVREAHHGIIKENFECKQCGKQFGNRHILQLHTRLHASQSSSSSEPSPGDAIATLTSATQSNGSLNINFNVSLNINLSEGIDSLDFDSKLNELLVNATKISFQEALRREKRLAFQLKNDKVEVNDNRDVTGNREVNGDGQASSEKIDVIPSQSSEPSESEPISNNESSSNAAPSVSNISNSESKEEQKKVEVTTSGIPESPSKVETIPPPKPPVRVNPHNRPKKSVGLTKIRMEDCQRCDACSCIYLDERDYIKHMKNFHKQDVLKKEPIKVSVKAKSRTQSSLSERRQSKRQLQLQQQQQQQQLQEGGGRKGSCRSCCKQCKCKGDHGTLEPLLPIVRPILGRSSRRGSTSSSQESWSQFAQHLEGAQGVFIRPHPEAIAQMKSDNDTGADLSDLLSQVEVKIKTEPVDQDETPVVVKLEPMDDVDSDTCSVY